MAKKAKAKDVPQAVASGPDKNYQAEDDMRTLTRAEEVKADKDRLGAAAEKAAEQAQAATKIAALHKRGAISDAQLAKMKTTK